MFSTSSPDNPYGTAYALAPEDIARGIRRRFECRPVVVDPSESDTYLYDPGNFWDGPTRVRWHSDIGHFEFRSYHGTEFFPMVGPLK